MWDISISHIIMSFPSNRWWESSRISFLRIKNSFKSFSLNILSSHSKKFAFWNITSSSILWYSFDRIQSISFISRHMTFNLWFRHFRSNTFKWIFGKFFKLNIFCFLGNSWLDLNLINNFIWQHHKFWFNLFLLLWNLNIFNFCLNFFWRHILEKFSNSLINISF